MACIENVPPVNGESEMEEGEIVDELDDLSDISSEEEFLLRQRLQVLENYNNVLERKKAKDESFESGKYKEDVFLQGLSEVSATDLDENYPSNTSIIVYRHVKNQKLPKPHHKPKRRKDLDSSSLGKPKDKKKVHKRKKIELKVISESSEESEDEYRNKRRKLANAVALNRDNNDKSSLQDRLQKMLGGKAQESLKSVLTQDKQTETELMTVTDNVKNASCSPIKPKDICIISIEDEKDQSKTENPPKECEPIDLCTDDDGGTVKTEHSIDTVDSVPKEKNVNNKKVVSSDSDEDLELLRQHALKSKALKTKSEQETVQVEPEKVQTQSDDEDSDTAELRLICLKSALLKKAIEMKQKQKLRKRLSQSSFSMQDDPLEEYKVLDRKESGNNTDIESMDMDIGSDGDEKAKETSNEDQKVLEVEHISNKQSNKVKQNVKLNKDDELEEDEDLLRAKLLTSLSKNLPNLVNSSVLRVTEEKKSAVKPPPAVPQENPVPAPPAPKTKVPEHRIIINLGESDSEGEHEATKNLTKMHMKLSEQVDFQQKLDLFLKSTRMEVEKKKTPDDHQNIIPKPPEKFVAKTVNHLPKSEQIEYRNLVKKMAELQKIKVARQSAMNVVNNTQVKDTLKPRNVSVDTSRIVAINMLEEQVALSRKKIAEESSRMLQLKEEATKLSQKYKIVATELKNISTAITLNKKEQRTVQNRLSKIRQQHQRLLNSSLNKHSKVNGGLTLTRPNLQKENNPLKDESMNPQILKNLKVSVVNDLREKVEERLSVQVDVNSNKKTVAIPASLNRVADIQNYSNETMDSIKESDASLSLVEKGGGILSEENTIRPELRIETRKEFNDYESPLQALEANWEADPNAIMCPFEVGGHCKDPDCKYLHTKVPSQ